MHMEIEMNLDNVNNLFREYKITINKQKMRMKRKLLLNQLMGRWLAVVLALLMMPMGLWAGETTTTYTFTGTTASSEQDCTYDVASTVGDVSKTWRVKNFSATDESNSNRSTSAYVLSESSFGISNIFATSSSGTVLDFMLVSDFTLTGNFVSAEITYSTSSMSSRTANVSKVGDTYMNLTSYNGTLGESPATLSLYELFADNKTFDGDKIALHFRFTTNRYDGYGGAFNIESIKITTTPVEYNLTIAGVQVTSDNAASVLGNEGTPSVVFDAENNKLTLNNAEITATGDAIVSGLDSLTVFLVGGENDITCNGVAFNKTAAVSNAKVTFTTDATSNGSLFIEVPANRLLGSGVTPAYTYLSLKDNGDNQLIDSSCGITVRYVDVTFFNNSDVLGDRKVSYDTGTHTLTLNGATSVTDDEDEAPGISFSDDVDLTIALIGNNTVRGSSGCIAIRKDGSELTDLYFAKGDETQHFSLTLIAESRDDLIYGFDEMYGNIFVSEDEDDGTFTRTIASSVYGGTGSEDEPFLIKTAEDLKNFADDYNDGRFSANAHIKLYTNIDCTGLTGFVPIGTSDNPFKGTFDGMSTNDLYIANLSCTAVSTDSYNGLFGVIDGGTVKNLKLAGCTFSGGDEVGAIVGHLTSGTINNCQVATSTLSSHNDDQNVIHYQCPYVKRLPLLLR